MDYKRSIFFIVNFVCRSRNCDIRFASLIVIISFSLIYEERRQQRKSRDRDWETETRVHNVNNPLNPVQMRFTRHQLHNNVENDLGLRVCQLPRLTSDVCLCVYVCACARTDSVVIKLLEVAFHTNFAIFLRHHECVTLIKEDRLSVNRSFLLRCSNKKSCGTRIITTGI